MLNDFELITKRFPDRPDVTIVPVSDVHLGAKEHMEREWHHFCDNLLNEPNTYIVLVGDLINNATKSSVSNVYDDVLRPREQKKLMVEALTPIKERILCAVSGNHERRSSREVDDDAVYDIMCKLDLEDVYRENMAFLKLQFGKDRADGLKNPTYCIGVTHGAGGGALTGASINRNERFGYIFDGLDALVVGHSHKPAITQPSKIKIDLHNNQISVKPFKVITATSWLNYGGYALQKQLAPSSFAPQTLVLTGRYKSIKATM